MNFLKLITLICISLPTFSQRNFQIKGKITHADNQTIVLITSEQDTLANAKIIDGAFKLKSKISEPQLCYLQDVKRNFRLPVFIEKGIILVSIELNQETNKIVKSSIEGSSEHDLYQSLLKAEKGHLTSDEMKQMQNWLKINDTTSINNLKKIKTREMDEAHETIKTIFANNPNSYAGGYYLGSIRNIGKQRLEKMYGLYSLLSPKIQKSYFGQKFYSQYQKESSIK